MILLYSFLLLFLGTLKMLIDRRVRLLEGKYVKTAKAVDSLSREPLYKGGNTTRPDTCQAAKRQYLLGLLVQKRDRLEDRHVVWQERSEWFKRLVTRVRSWKGRKLPYTLGVLDMSFVLYLIDFLGVGEYVSLPNLLRIVTSCFSN